MSATLFREGTDLDALLAELDAEHPGQVQVVDVEYGRQGGVLGFFAHRRVGVHYRLVGEATDELADEPAAAGIEDLLAAADAAEARRGPAPDTEGDPSRDQIEFARMLLELANAKQAQRRAAAEKSNGFPAFPSAPLAERGRHRPTADATSGFGTPLASAPVTGSAVNGSAVNGSMVNGSAANGALTAEFAPNGFPGADAAPMVLERLAPVTPIPLTPPPAPQPPIPAPLPAAAQFETPTVELPAAGTPDTQTLGTETPDTETPAAETPTAETPTPEAPLTGPAIAAAPTASRSTRPAGAHRARSDSDQTWSEYTLRRRLVEVGVPVGWIPQGADNTYWVVEQLVRRLELCEPVAAGPGEVIAVAGPGAAALESARALAVRMRLDPDEVHAAGCEVRDDRRIETWTSASIAARYRSQASTPLVVAVALDDPADAQDGVAWAAQIVRGIVPDRLHVIVDAGRKSSDARRVLEAVRPVHSLFVTGAARTTSPASVWELGAPIELLDGRPATTGAWAALLLDALAALERS